MAACSAVTASFPTPPGKLTRGMAREMGYFLGARHFLERVRPDGRGHHARRRSRRGQGTGAPLRRGRSRLVDRDGWSTFDPVASLRRAEAEPPR